MSREEIQSLMTRAKRSLRSAGNLHSGVIAAFGQHLVKSGRFTAEHQQSRQAAFADRSGENTPVLSRPAKRWSAVCVEG